MNILRLENHRLLYILTSLLRRGIHFCSHLEWRLQSQVLVCLFLCFFFTFIMCPIVDMARFFLGGLGVGCVSTKQQMIEANSQCEQNGLQSLFEQAVLFRFNRHNWALNVCVCMYIYIYLFIYIFIYFNTIIYLLLPLLLRLCVSQSSWNIWHLHNFSSTFRANSPFHKGQKSLLLLTGWT